MTHGIGMRDLTVRYGDTAAVDGLTADLPGGMIHGLLGRNGSGKTSLLSVIAAFRRASGGEVTIDGQPVFENAAVMRDLCLIRGPGDTVTHDWPDDRVEHALDFAALMRPRWDPALANRLTETFELPRRARIGQLSTGKRAALGVTLGLASRAPVTLFDESHLGMDVPSRYAFYDLMLEDLATHPRTVVISTHHIEEIARLFEQVLIIDRGRLVVQDDADTLRAKGSTVTGPAAEVDRFTAELGGAEAGGPTVLSARQLGPTREATVFGALTDADRHRAAAAGLELGPVGLQDLFVHLTDPDRPTHDRAVSRSQR